MFRPTAIIVNTIMITPVPTAGNPPGSTSTYCG
jgi:hypothetical protein